MKYRRVMEEPWAWFSLGFNKRYTGVLERKCPPGDDLPDTHVRFICFFLFYQSVNLGVATITFGWNHWFETFISTSASVNNGALLASIKLTVEQTQRDAHVVQKHEGFNMRNCSLLLSPKVCDSLHNHCSVVFCCSSWLSLSQVCTWSLFGVLVL